MFRVSGEYLVLQDRGDLIKGRLLAWDTTSVQALLLRIAKHWIGLPGRWWSLCCWEASQN